MIALYARKSVERENSISCETQIEYCKSMLKPDERDDKIVTFIDNGFSGGNVDRDGFQKMMRLVRKNKINKVIVYKLDRISRSLTDFVSILGEFREYGVKFVSSQESFDTSSPYGDMLVKLLMVFAEFERTSTIQRVTQAYEHRSEMGFYMGGRKPYGYELVETVIHNVKTKKLNAIPAEAAQVRYLFEVYAQEAVSLRQLQKILIAEGKRPLNGSEWTTSKLSTLLKNPIYVKADSDVYNYYDRHGTQMISDPVLFTGACGAQLYGQTKHTPGDPDWSDMKLVLLSHEGIVTSEIWLKCQKKLQSNRQIGNSLSNQTSWLSGKIVCEKCGHTMTTIKGKVNKAGELRRYFNCTGKSHQKACTGSLVTIYAEDLEDMVYDCITEKLSEMTGEKRTATKYHSSEVNKLKLKILAIEKSEQKLMDSMLSGGFYEELLTLANQKASQLQKDRLALYEKLEALQSRSKDVTIAVNLSELWKNTDHIHKKAVTAILIDKIVISEDGTTKIFWNI